MRKINKDLSLVPISLRIPVAENFQGTIPTPSKTTNNRRVEVIDNGAYIDNNKYNSRYKQTDVKEALIKLYRGKCAFCENKVESFHVEHYRPKNIYYWLAYSWDNLLVACGFCNIYKGENFDLSGQEYLFIDSDDSRRNINSLSHTFDENELPLLLNPEKTDASSLIVFHKDGSIVSDNARMTYTIDTCRLDRSYLNDQRRKLIDVFIRDINSAAVMSKSVEEQLVRINTIFIRFLDDKNDADSTFLAFRIFMINNWLKSIIKEILSKKKCP